jgi:hypothetical protein
MPLHVKVRELTKAIDPSLALLSFHSIIKIRGKRTNQEMFPSLVDAVGIATEVTRAADFLYLLRASAQFWHLVNTCVPFSFRNRIGFESRLCESIFFKILTSGKGPSRRAH